MAKVQFNRPAGLKPRPGTRDEAVPVDLLERLSLFQELQSGKSKAPRLTKFPGAVVLRQFDAAGENEPIIRQGEPGYSAFYILTTEDQLELRELQRELAAETGRQDEPAALRLAAEIARLKSRLSELPAAATREAIRLRGKVRGGLRQLIRLHRALLASPDRLPPAVDVEELRQSLGELERRQAELLRQTEETKELADLRAEVEKLRGQAAATAGDAGAPALPRLPSDPLKLRSIGMACLLRLIERDQDQASASTHRKLLRRWQRATERTAKELYREARGYAAEHLDLSERSGALDLKALEERVQRRIERLRRIRGGGATGLRRVATVSLELPAAAPSAKRPWWKRLFSGKAAAAPAVEDRARAIFADLPCTLSRERPVNVLYEGELFGEMSCQYRTPRSATVRADAAAADDGSASCCLLEMLSNIYDKLTENELFQASVREGFEDREFNAHLDGHEVFRSLSFAAREELRRHVRLHTLHKGEVIVDEHERADDLYLIRRGYVKVQQGVSSLLAPGDIRELPGLCRRLVEAANAGPSPRWRLWQAVPRRLRAKVAETPAGQIDDKSQADIANAVAAALSDASFQRDEAAWRAWCELVQAGKNSDGSPAARFLWQSLDDAAQKAVESAAHGESGGETKERAAIAQSFAALLKMEKKSALPAALTAGPKAAAKPAPPVEETALPPAKKPSAAEILALAKAAKKPSVVAAAVQGEENSAKPPAKKPSAAEILAMAKVAKRTTVATVVQGEENAAKPQATSPSVAADSAPPVMAKAPPTAKLADDPARWIDFCRLLVECQGDAPGAEHLIARRLAATSAWSDVQALANSSASTNEETDPRLALEQRVIAAVNDLIRLDGPHGDKQQDEAEAAWHDELLSAVCRPWSDGPSGTGRRPSAAAVQRVPPELRADLRAASLSVELEEEVCHHIACAVATAGDASGGGTVDVEAALAGQRQLTAQQRWRHRNRLLLQTAFPEFIPPPAAAGAPRVLSYRGKGEVIGEVGLVTEHGLRTATCVAFDDRHERDPYFGAKVDLVRIEGAFIRELGERYPAFRRRLGEVAAARLRGPAAPPLAAAVRPELSQRFAELGLKQGQRLMLIDLDRCTRCDECVKACVQTHERHDAVTSRLSGGPFTRLYLDGPRIGRHLVPATCRQCHDPVCLIGCPVGSIHKGDLGQIVIENWCIGCSTCAENCPYDAIQMQPTGLVQRQSAVVRLRGSQDDGNGQSGAAWVALDFDDQVWSIAQTPIFAGFELRRASGGGPLRLRHEFMVRRASCLDDRGQPISEYELRVDTPHGVKAKVWLNGDDFSGQKNPVFGFASSGPAADEATDRQANDVLREGRNVLAFEVEIPTNVDSSKPLLDFCLLEIREPEVPLARLGVDAEYEEKTVDKRAMVCDMCTSHPSQTPACVSACPHDAAWRGDPTAADSPLRLTS